MLENILSHQIVQKLGWTLLHFVWQAGVAALLLAILLRALRKSTASLRYAIACSVLGLIVLLPVVTIRLVPVSASSSPLNVAYSLPAKPADLTSQIAALETPALEELAKPERAATASWQQQAIELFEPVLPYVVLGWIIGVLVLAVWHLGGWAQLLRLKRRIANEADSPLTSRAGELADRLGVKRAVRLLESALVQVPTVVGWLRPVILLPASALTGLTPEQLEALLAHELAHIKRLDYLVNMLQTVVEILGFYHPAVWWVSHKIRLERENCCDDMAVSICGDARQYAKALAEMERIRSGDVELAVAASGGNLSQRISRLLGREASGKSLAGWAPAVIAAVLLIALVIPASLAISGRSAEDTRAAVVRDLLMETTANRMLPPAPVLTNIEDKTQIDFECKLIEVPSDCEFVKDKNPGDVIIRLDGEFSGRLEALISATQGANVMAAPRVIILEGEAAMMAIGEKCPCITGYEPGAGTGGKPKPIIENVFCGLELKIKANVIEGDAVHMDIRLTMRSMPTKAKDASGRKIHQTTSNEFTTEITVDDGDTVIIRGPKDADRPNRTMILQITPHISRPDERVNIPVKAGEYPVTMAIKAADYAKAANAKAGQNPLGMAIRLVLDSIDQLTAAGTQIDDLAEVRKILSAQGFIIDAANFSGDKSALTISKPIDDGIKGRLACRLTKQNDSLLIDRIDFEPARPARQEPPTVKPSAPKPTEMTPTAGKGQQDSAESIVRIFKLKYANCEQAATILTPLLTSDRRVIIVPDPRSNQLLVQATAPDLQQIEQLIAEIDVVQAQTPRETTGLEIKPRQDRQTVMIEQLPVLEKERQALVDKLQTQRQTIRQLAQEYGTADLTKHQDMKLQRVATLLDTRTKTEARRMQLETEQKLLEQTGEQTATPQELLKMRQDHINSDPTIKALAEKLAQVEMELLLARQTSTESSPEVAKKVNLLQALNKRLDGLKNDVGQSFDELMAKEAAKGKQQKLARLQAELQQLGEYDRRLSNLLNLEDSEIVKLGRKQLDIQDLQRQVDLDQQMYDTLCLRLKEQQQSRSVEQAEVRTVPDAAPPEPATRDDQNK